MTSHQTIKKARETAEGAICSDRLNTRHGNSGGGERASGVVMERFISRRGDTFLREQSSSASMGPAENRPPGREERAPGS